MKFHEALEASLPSASGEKSWAERNRLMAQQAAKQYQYTPINCAVCKMPFGSESPIKSHTVSEQHLRKIADSFSRVNFLDYKLSIQGNLKEIQEASTSIAGVRYFAHSKCDQSAFLPYESGDFSSPKGSLSLINKILHSSYQGAFEWVQREYLELAFTQKAFEQEILREPNIALASKRQLCLQNSLYFEYAKHHSILANIEDLARTRMLRDLLRADHVWSEHRVVDSIGPIATQGFTYMGGVNTTKMTPFFFGYLPHEEIGKSHFFVAAVHSEDELIHNIRSIPLYLYFRMISLNPKSFFWRKGYTNSMIEDFAKQHGGPGGSISKYADVNAVIDLIPKDLPKTEQDLLKMSINDL